METVVPRSVDQTEVFLAAVWLDLRRTSAQALTSASTELAAWRDEPEFERLQALSIGYEALRWPLAHYGEAAGLAATEHLLNAARRSGHLRAIVLAETAWAWMRVDCPELQSQARALLESRSPSTAALVSKRCDLVDLELAWAYLPLCVLHCLAGEYSHALDCALQSEALAVAYSHDLMRAQAATQLSFVYLSVGDLEGAFAVLPSGLACSERCGRSATVLHINHLLALVLSQQFDVAAKLLADQSVLCSEGLMSRQPFVMAMVARVRMTMGQHPDAQKLPPLSVLLATEEAPQVTANRLWITADALTGLGRAAEARTLLQDGLRHFRAGGIKLLPMNDTQIHRALADACEAEGDLPAALLALRESQSRCFAWVGESMRARLQSLHFATTLVVPDTLRRHQHLRFQRVDQALSELRASSLASVSKLPRSDLLAQVTHEVRNPLNGVVWMTSLLMMSDLDERQREYLDLANSSARMALSLCNDVLELAKLDAGWFSLNPTRVDLRALVAECARMYEAPARAKGVGVHWHFDAALPDRLLADPLRLRQVLMNLLSNATKFTFKGRIDVGVLWLGYDAVTEAPTVRLSVTDTGPGVPVGLLPRLFQEFEQADSEPTKAQVGAGLGLALCRQFVRMMGGEIGVNSRPSLGCTFWCMLPLRPL